MNNLKRFLLTLVIMSLMAVPMVMANGQQDAEEEGVVTINVAADPNGASYELMQEQAGVFMSDNPGVNVELLDTPQSTTDLLGIYLQFFEAQSEELDVYRIDVIWPGDLAQHFLDLNEYPEARAAAQEHFPAIVENNTVDGKLVGMPWFTDAGLLAWRTDLLDKYGYDGPPETWQDLEEMATTIQEGERSEGNEDFWGFVWQGAAYEGLTCAALEWVASNNGGTIVSPNRVITINNSNAIEAVERAASWIGEISPDGVTGWMEEDARNYFQAGNAAFQRNWPYIWSLGNSDDSAIAGEFEIGPLPAGRGTPAATLGGWQLGVSNYSANPDEAVAVLLHFTNYESQVQNAVDGSYHPTIPACYEDERVLGENPYMANLLDVFTNATARPSTATAPNYNQSSVLFFNAVHEVLTGDTDAQTALEELELDLIDLLGYETGDPM
ncbi:MAG: ABC transporter substrate-binding protein [Spirochaetia bacterium]